MPTVVVSKDIVHILLIGGDNDNTLYINTDTLIVVAVDKKTKHVSLLSIPRDLWVHIPGHGWSRINRAHRLGDRHKYPGGGPALLMRTIEENLGIPIDHWIRIQFDGFKRVVDELGGVDIIVPCPVHLGFQTLESGKVVDDILEAGVHHMDGATALRFVRTRRDDGVSGRARRNQQFLKAVWNQTRGPDVILRIPELWSALRGNFETDLTLGDVLALAPIALDLEPGRVRSLYIGYSETRIWTTPKGWWVLVPYPDKVRQVVTSLYAPPSADEEQVRQEAARIQIWNGTQRPQLELFGADQLRWVGLNIVETGPAAHPDYEKTQIVVFSDKPYTLALLTQLLRVREENVIRQPDPSQAVDIQVILGKDYDPCR